MIACCYSSGRKSMPSWLANLVAWVTRRASANDVVNHLELATRLLLTPA